MSSIVIVRSLLATLAIAAGSGTALAQEPGAEPTRVAVSANVSVTNEGISLIPTFTLGRPAVVVDLALTKSAVSFEPQVAYSLHGKPWTIIFWGRYRPIQSDRFRQTLGAHPALSFDELDAGSIGVTGPSVSATRYAAADVMPMYTVTRHLAVGGYYLYGRALDPVPIRNNNYLAVRAGLSGLPAGSGLSVDLAPQLCYLDLSGQTGEYVSLTASVTWRESPVSVSTMISTPLRTDVVGGTDTVWNISLNYRLR